MSKKKSYEKTALSKKNQQVSEPQCCCTKTKSSASIQCNKNRVTIFGQLGQTESDKYTLEYAAKINDTPLSPEVFSQYYNTSDDQENSNDNNYKQVASHAVQVNIRERWEKPDKRLSAGNDQAIQCHFERLSLVPDVQNVDSSEETNVLKKCNSPVIVISVYPRPDIKISTNKIMKKSKPTTNKYFSNVAVVKNTKNSVKNDTSQTRRIKSRSASPVVKKIDKNKTEDNLQPQKAPRSKIKNSANASNINHKIIKSEQQSVNKNYTTEIKQTLIDNFIKSMESEDDTFTKFLLSVPKTTASKITIDLNKQHDVVLNSHKKEVNVVNQKNKFKDPNKAVATKKLSIVNGKIVSDKRLSSMNKFGKMNTKSSYSKPMQLKPRDSLVVNHSREIRRSEIQNMNGDNTNKIRSTTGTRNHYRGDNCSIDDPNIRDKEIQRLLGLTTKKTTRLAKASEINVKHCGFKKRTKTITISVNKKHQPRPSYIQGDRGDQNYKDKPLDKNVDWQDKLIKEKDLTFPPIIINKTNKIINRVPKSQSYRNDKGLNTISSRLQNYDLDYFHSELQKMQPSLICDNDFFHAHKCYRYRRNELPTRQYNKTTMTAKNTVVNYLQRNKDIGLPVVGSVKMERTDDKQLHFERKILAENKNHEKYAQTDKNLRNKGRFKTVRDSNYRIKKNMNKLLRFASESMIDQEKRILLQPTLSAIEVSNNFNFILKSKTPISYLTQKENELNLKNYNQVDHVKSLRVIYEGHKRSISPNLGTSFISISVKSSKTTYQPHERRKNKLCHILSFIVKKMQRNSNILKTDRLKKVSTANTIDSYCINSSLAPWDMSSVLFDTSASYYSRHSLHGSTRLKRGFLSSVCDFFARRKRHGQIDTRVKTLD